MPYPSYPFSSPLLADEEDALGLSLGGDDTADDPNTDPNTDPTTGANRYQATTPAVAPDLMVKFSAPKPGELPGFVGEDRVLLQKPEIPETQITPAARQSGMGIGTGTGPGMLQPPTLDQSNLQAYTQHMGTSPFGKKPGFWNKLAAGLYGGASVLAATQAQPHVSRVNPMQIANGVQGILRPGQGRMMQEWDLKRRGLEDAARIEAMNNNAKMKQYATDAEAPMNSAKEIMYRKHGNFYDTLGAARWMTAMNPKQNTPNPPGTPLAAIMRRNAQKLASGAPQQIKEANDELDWFKRQYANRTLPTKNRMEIQAYMNPYTELGFDEDTAEKFATLDWSVEEQRRQEGKDAESKSRTEVNTTKSALNEAQTNKINRTPVGSGNDSAKADAEVKRKGEALAESLRDQADNDATEALAILAEMGSRIPEPIRVHAKAVLMDRRDRKSKDDDILGAFNDAVGGTKSSTSKPVGKATTTAAPTTPATAPKSTKPSKELVYQGGKFVPAKPAAK